MPMDIKKDESKRLKGLSNITESELKRIKTETDKSSVRGYSTTNVLFKKIKDTEDHRIKFIGINKKSGEVQSILNYKQFTAFAKMYRHNQVINKIMKKDKLNRVEAKAEYKKRVEYIENKQLTNINEK